VLGIGRTTFDKLIENGDIHIVRTGRAVRVPLAKARPGRDGRAVRFVNDTAATLRRRGHEQPQELRALLAHRYPDTDRVGYDGAATKRIAVLRGE
jgi:hypothetical protein